MDLPDDETCCVDAEGCARRFGTKIGRQAQWALRQKNQKNPEWLFFAKIDFCPTTWFGVDSW